MSQRPQHLGGFCKVVPDPDGFCFYGILTAFWVRYRHHVEAEPASKDVFHDLEVAMHVLGDEQSLQRCFFDPGMGDRGLVG